MGAPLILEPAFLKHYQKTVNGESHGTLSAQIPTEKKLLLELHRAWWQILQHEKIEENSAYIFNALNGLKRATPTAEKCTNLQLYLFSSAALFAIRLEALNGNKISGAKRYLEAMPYLKVILKRAEQADELKLIAALYHFGMQEFINQNRILTPIFWSFPDADFDQGKKWMLECTQSNSAFVSTEARYFMFKFHNNLFKNKVVAKNYLKDLVQQYPGNKVLWQEWAALQGPAIKG